LIYLCAISNISSGSCAEDCSFCTQSARNHADIEKFKHKDISKIIAEAILARKNRAIGFCLVTAGKGITDASLEYVTRVAFAVKKVEPDLNIIACNGTATLQDLRELKKHGVGSYNHNLESSQNYYKEICTTHSWEDRYQTCLNVKEIGLNLCSGGIWGMGESDMDRLSLVASLKELQPASIAMNFFHANEALPLKKNTLTKKEALEIVRYVSNELYNSRIMVAGGREKMFGDEWTDIFDMGANSIVVGDYLTTIGEVASKDIMKIESLGLEIARDCDAK
jgi:biotin synthase